MTGTKTRRRWRRCRRRPEASWESGRRRKPWRGRAWKGRERRNHRRASSWQRRASPRQCIFRNVLVEDSSLLVIVVPINVHRICRGARTRRQWRRHRYGRCQPQCGRRGRFARKSGHRHARHCGWRRHGRGWQSVCQTSHRRRWGRSRHWRGGGTECRCMRQRWSGSRQGWGSCRHGSHGWRWATRKHWWRRRRSAAECGSRMRVAPQQRMSRSRRGYRHARRQRQTAEWRSRYRRRERRC